MAEWRSHPITRLLLQHLDQQARWANDAAMQATMRGEYPVATAHAGSASTFNGLFAACTEPREPAPAPAQDSTFVHPSKRKVGHAVTLPE